MDSANLVVLNTCSVREQPEKRAHGQLSLLRHAKRSRVGPAGGDDGLHDRQPAHDATR